MAFLSYRPLTQHDRKLGSLMMAAGAACFTIAASSIEANENSENSKESWLLIGSSLFPYFSGMLWLVLNSRYRGRAWGQLIFSGCSSSGTTIGVSQLFFDIEPLVMVGLAMCAWATTIIFIVCRDSFRENSGYYERETRREESIPEYAIGTPSDPAWHDHGRDAQQAGRDVEMTSCLPGSQNEDPGSKV